VPGTFEKKIADRMEWWAKLKAGEKARDPDDPGS